MILHHQSRWLLIVLLATLSSGVWINEPKENYKSRRSLRREWRGVGRLRKTYGFQNDVWAGQYMPDKTVRWMPNEVEESAISAAKVDLCGHSCNQGVSLFGFAVCQVDWKTGCPDDEPPEGVTLDSQLYDLCPKECDAIDPSKQEGGDSGGNVLDHVKVWTITDGKDKTYDKTKIRIELMPQPNPNVKDPSSIKPKRDPKCVCTGCPKPEKKEIKVDPEKLARAKGEKSPKDAKKDAGEKKKTDESNADEPEAFVGAEKDAKQTCPQCCMDAFKSDWNHVYFHDLNDDKQDEPEVEVRASYPDSEEH